MNLELVKNIAQFLGLIIGLAVVAPIIVFGIMYWWKFVDWFFTNQAYSWIKKKY